MLGKLVFVSGCVGLPYAVGLIASGDITQGVVLMALILPGFIINFPWDGRWN